MNQSQQPAREAPSLDLDAVAVKIVDQEYASTSKLPPLDVPGCRTFGALTAFSDTEFEQLTSLRDLVEKYIKQSSPVRPLCLCVFGPPGSGKSFAVKQIRGEVEKQLGDKRTRLPMTIVNLTQVSHAVEIGRVVARIAGEQDEETVPLVFFDEFDASRQGAQCGWLSWFLAPMHDGEFLHEGAPIRLRRAIYIFAGGTASSMREFASRSQESEFRAAKGPDFISRLRGFLDVLGPNAEPRSLRRAVLLRNEFAGLAKRLGATGFRVNQEIVRSLLGVGRFRYGARSITAILELSDLDFTASEFDWGQLPEDHLLALHIDRGPLDARLIGGSIALSGFRVNKEEEPSTPKLSDELTECWLQVATTLWGLGATLAYAGAWGQERKSSQLMTSLVGELKLRSVEPSRHEATRKSPSPWLESYQRGRSGATDPTQEDLKHGLRVTTANYLTDSEASNLRPWQQKILGRFRQRLSVTEGSVARFAVGGATTTHEGRAPGIAEEVMLSLAIGQPVYIAGAFGGACAEIGRLLGLSHPSASDEAPSLDVLSTTRHAQVQLMAEKFRPTPLRDLPVQPPEIADYLRDHACGGTNWPINGLSRYENRQLFQSTNPAEISQLVALGLLRLHDTH